ncbi:MAG: hypothetical protein HXY34_02130 [Candidatus Thorarchaeota archaeon]|nr:hypothetical protein [Candidatus Thorarchaeota archaeon]
MDEDERVRAEPADRTQAEEPKGFYAPLPSRQEPVRKKAGVTVVTLLGVPMREESRDLILSLMMPFLVALFDAGLFAAITTNTLPLEALYFFVIPMVAAVPIGMTIPQTGRALVCAILTGVFFVIIFMLFLISPGIAVPDVGIAEFFLTGLGVSAAYFVFIVFASLAGTFFGIIAREFL